MKEKRLFIGCFNKSVLLTYFGIFSAITGICFLMCASDFNREAVAILCLVVSGICDLFDGAVARKCKRNDVQKQFGIHIDSFADILAFGIFPVCILIHIIGAIAIPVGIIYIIAAVTRLAWFNINANSETRTEFFSGVPVTYISLLLPVIYAATGTFMWHKWLMAVCMVVFSFFMVLNIKVPKPKGKWYLIFPLIAIITGCVIVLRYL